MTESGLLGITVRCHPELVSGSGFDPLSGGLRTVDGQRCLQSDQRFLSLKRTADLRIEMMKQVQMTESLTKNQEPGRVASERRTILRRFFILGLVTWNSQLATALHEGPRTFFQHHPASLSKRPAPLKAEMMKQVQMTESLTKNQEPGRGASERRTVL